MISLKDVTVMRRKEAVLDGLSLQIRPKECLCVTSDTPDTLSALFRVLATLEQPSSGTMEVDNVDVSILPDAVRQLFRGRVGLMFHPSIAIDYLTVGQNIALPLHLRGLPVAVIAKATDDLLKRCGLTSKVSLFPRDLTDEERQMMCVARCVVTAPLVIVAQEPFRGLSEKSTAAAVSLFQNLRKKGSTLVFLSESPACAHAMDVSPVTLRNGRIADAMPVIHRAPEPRQEAMATTPLMEQEERVQVREIPKPMPQRTPDAATGGKKIHITAIGSSLS